MKILAVSDEESDALWSGRVREIAGNVDVIVSCGDLRNEYLEFLLTMINAPLLYVFGNHDVHGAEGGICIDGRVIELDGVRFLGLGGSMRYRQGVNMYSEDEMRWRYWRVLPGVWLKGGVDVLVTHAPALGWGDLDDRAHRGFGVFNTILARHRPRFMLHGHIHTAYGRFRKEHIHDSGTRIMNVCGCRIIDINSNGKI
ncbi:MAG: metallophosphoesterase family protein [Synergistaceae bacterium]|nr:metallophosphoesterase family protein [Synergistaceae bacterium]